MKVLYVHGFGSRFDPTNDKVLALSALGDVSGFDYDYTAHPDQIKKDLQDHITKNKIDLVVGTSLGGYFAIVASTECGIPYVAMNPAVEPHITLKKYVGDGQDYLGNKYHLSDYTVDQYPSIIYMKEGGFGVVLLDEGDDVIDPLRSASVMLDRAWRVVSFKGGSHRFEHAVDSIDMIKTMLNVATFVDGTA